MPLPSKARKSYQLNLRLRGFNAWIPQYYAGVYRIRNTATGECYIGSTSNLRSRRSCHRHLLTYEAHTMALQSAFNIHGPEAFIFEIVLFCEREWLDLYESALIRRERPAYNGNRKAAK